MWSIFKAFLFGSPNILSEAKSEFLNLNNIVKIDSNTINYCLQYVLNELNPISFYQDLIFIISTHQPLEVIDLFTIAYQNWFNHFIMKLFLVEITIPLIPASP